MALVANVYLNDVDVLSGTASESFAAGALDGYVMIFGLNALFHVLHLTVSFTHIRLYIFIFRKSSVISGFFEDRKI